MCDNDIFIQVARGLDLLQVDLHEKNKRRRTRASERERRSRVSYYFQNSFA